MGPDDLIAYIDAGRGPGPRQQGLCRGCASSDRPGAVVTYAAYETSKEGFDAEWRGIAVFTVEGEMVNRTEIFDEADLDAALARFEELSRPAPRLENTASRVTSAFRRASPPGDWDVMAEMLSAGLLPLTIGVES